MSAAAQPCPCGRESAPLRPLALANCCGRFMGVAETPALDPESLMRSRYSAFVLERADYLLATWHPRTRPAQLEFEPGARWLGLAVKRHQSTGPDAAVVEFVARYRVGGKAVRLHEVSRFEREAGRWWYLDGEQR